MAALGTMERSDGAFAVRFSRDLDATPESVFRCLVDPAQLSKWLATATVEPVVGGGIHLRWDAGHDEIRGVVTEFVDGRVLECSWSAGDGDDVPSLLRLEVEPLDGTTRLHLVHAGVAKDEAADLGARWQSHLEALEELLAGRTPARPVGAARYEALLGDYRALVEGT